MTDHAPQRPFWARFGIRLILLGVSALLAVLAAEAGLRIAGYKPPLSSAWVLTSQRLVDAEVVTINPNFVEDAFYAPYENRGAAKLIVALGDSFTESFPVPERESYPRALERMLVDRGFDVKVLNVGLGDTGTDQQLKLFVTRILPRLRPDIVVWQFYPNDTYENVIKAVYADGAGGTLTPVSATSNWMYRRQQFFDAMPLPARLKESSYVFNLLLRRYERDLEVAVPTGADKLEWGRQKIGRAVAHMNALAAEHGFRVYYTLVAPESVYRSDVPIGTPGATEAAEYGAMLPIVEKEPTYIRGRFWSAQLDDDQFGARLFVGGDRDPSPLGSRHLNEEGYRLLAARIAERVLLDEGMHIDGVPPPDAVSETTAAPIVLQLGDGSSRRFLRRGWQPMESEGGHRWSDGMESVLDLPLPKVADVRMEFECRPFSFPGSPPQTVTISVNGKEIQQLTLDADRAKYQITLPRSTFREWPDVVSIRYGYGRRPMDVITGSGDTRTLAVVWYSIDFVPIR